jgi:hypoxanthine phosphoribosyltransferase
MTRPILSGALVEQRRGLDGATSPQLVGLGISRTDDAETEQVLRSGVRRKSIAIYAANLFGTEDNLRERAIARKGDAAMIESYDYARRKGTRELGWDTCTDLAAGLAEALEPLRIDAVVGIARGGLIPAATVALSLRREMFPIRLSRRVNDEVKYDSPVWWIRVPPDVAGLRVAVVDEIADSGETLRLARQAVVDAGAVDVVTTCLVQHSWAQPEPTFSGLISDELIIFPWKRRVLRNGVWRPHPELQAALRLSASANRETRSGGASKPARSAAARQ